MDDLYALIDPVLKAGLDNLTRQPRQLGQLNLPGLAQPVRVDWNAQGVPFIHAQSLADAFRAQGYLHAQERLFQMDFNRRLVAGRLSEVLGSVSLPVDRWMRTLTMRRVAEYEVNLINAQARQLLDSYVDGINAFIEHGPLPVEFSLLRYRPEPWILADLLAWIKMMSWSLSVNWETELLRARLIAQLGESKAAELEPDLFDRWPVTLPPGVDYSQVGDSALQRSLDARPFSGPSPYEGIGSNSWVVAGSRTSTGTPLLANDMHLSLTIPSVWYENHLITPEVHLAGITFPGIPGIVSGHNGHVAWAFTNGYPDVQDLYMERLQRHPSGAWQEEVNGVWQPIRTLHETIRVRDAEPVIEEVRITRHGPVINSLAADLSGEVPLALQWTALDPDTTLQSFIAVYQAKTCAEFYQSLRGWAGPVQNISYADIHGDIGYTLAGRIPLRKQGQGLVPVPGWTDEYAWEGYIPFDELPHLSNPPAGFIATANARVAGPDYPHYLGREVVSGDRALRITELIESQPKINPDFIRQMHFDVISPSARTVAAHLARLAEPGPRLQPVVNRMAAWDGSLHADSAEAAVYQAFMRQLLRRLLSDRVDDLRIVRSLSDEGMRMDVQRSDLTERILGKGPNPVLADSSLFGFRALEFALYMLDHPESPWWDFGSGADQPGVMRQALEDALAHLRSTLGPRLEDWQWGKLHTLTYAHSLARARVLAGYFNRGPFPISGDGTTVFATGGRLYTYQQEAVNGPPFRMLIDLGNLDNSLGLLAPGQSGRPDSIHYDDQIEDWFSVDGYHPMPYTPQAIQAASKGQLTLIP